MRESKLEYITQLLILAGIVTHPVWNWSFKTAFILKPSDFFFALAIAGSIFYFLGDGRNNLKKIPKLLYVALFLFGASIILGTVMGYLRYGIPVGDWHLILHHLERIGGGFILLLFFFISLKESIRFRQRLYGAFWVSAFPFIPFLFWPALAQEFGMVTDGHFMGLAGNTGMFAALIFPAFVFAFFLFLRSLFAKDAKGSPVRILLFCFLWLAIEALILWSASKAFFGAVVLSVIFGTLIAGYFYKVGPKRIFSSLTLILIVVFLLLPFSPAFEKFKGFSLFPESFSKSMDRVKRIVELQTKNEISEIPRAGEELPFATRPVGFYYYISLFKEDPLIPLLGLGINYAQKFDLILSRDQGINSISIGRSILSDIFLYGGVGAVIAVIIFIWLIWQRIIMLFRANERERSIEPIYVLAPAVTLLGWWSAAIFLGTPFILIPNWILLGMALAPEAPKTN